MRLPKGLLLDYGGTLVEEVSFDPRAGNEALLARAVCKPAHREKLRSAATNFKSKRHGRHSHGSFTTFSESGIKESRGRTRELPNSEFGSSRVRPLNSLISQILEIVVVQTEEVSHFVDNGRLDFFPDLFLALTLLFDRALKNGDTIRIKRSAEATLSQGRAFIQTEKCLAWRDFHVFKEFSGGAVLHNDDDILETGSKILRQLTDSLLDKVFKLDTIHPASVHDRRVAGNSPGETEVAL
jgi:hypothetical protein